MTTRAAAKQQQDDHMATLIAMLGEQRERQEELAARHQSRLEQLIEEQQQRWDLLAERQGRAEEQVHMVRSDLRAGQ